MTKLHNPSRIAPPIGTYSHGAEVPPNARWLYVAGQIGLAKDGSVPATIEGQTEVAWQNVAAVLAAASMRVADIVKVNQYLTRLDHFPGYAAARARHLGDHRPASTLVVVSALVKPEYLVEVEVVAARAAPAAAARVRERAAPPAKRTAARKPAKRARRR
ncbi:MAG: RidA family protein [Burkholderiales bacterium]|nr:RidA family protein [Burkholderiales bacterium]